MCIHSSSCVAIMDALWWVAMTIFFLGLVLSLPLLSALWRRSGRAVFIPMFLLWLGVLAGISYGITKIPGVQEWAQKQTS